MYSRLIHHINQYVQLDSAETERLESALHYRELKKKTHILKEGQICTANYFIVKGLLRMYFINENKTEQVSQFGIENWWITDYGSMDNQTPSRFFIQAVEPSEIIVFRKDIQEEIFTRVPKLERYFRMVLQKTFAAYQLRIRYIYEMSAEKRYHHFSTSYPGFVQRVPQYMLASYLGFTPEFLSRIRAGKV